MSLARRLPFSFDCEGDSSSPIALLKFQGGLGIFKHVSLMGPRKGKVRAIHISFKVESIEAEAGSGEKNIKTTTYLHLAKVKPGDPAEIEIDESNFEELMQTHGGWSMEDFVRNKVAWICSFADDMVDMDEFIAHASGEQGSFGPWLLGGGNMSTVSVDTLGDYHPLTTTGFIQAIRYVIQKRALKDDANSTEFSIRDFHALIHPDRYYQTVAEFKKTNKKRGDESGGASDGSSADDDDKSSSEDDDELGELGFKSTHDLDSESITAQLMYLQLCNGKERDTRSLWQHYGSHHRTSFKLLKTKLENLFIVLFGKEEASPYVSHEQVARSELCGVIQHAIHSWVPQGRIVRRWADPVHRSRCRSEQVRRGRRQEAQVEIRQEVLRHQDRPGHRRDRDALHEKGDPFDRWHYRLHGDRF